MSLNPQQLKFVQEYMVDMNSGQAAIRAGYSAATAYQIASRLLKNVHVSAALNKEMAARGSRLQLKADRIIIELMRVAFANIRDVARWNQEKLEYIPSDDIDDDAASAIAEITDKTTATSGRNGDTVKREQRVKMHDKLRALELLGKYLGMWKADQGDGQNQMAQFMQMLSSGAINMDQVVDHLGKKSDAR